MKTIYFVRHGESDGNANNLRQTGDTSLTGKGLQQSKLLADRCKKLPIEIILCSPMVRAKQTAEIISDKISKQIEYTGLLIERREPKEVLGKPMTDKKAEEVENIFYKNFHLNTYRYSDEENFVDLKNRVKGVLELISSKREDNILVVTHGLFLRIIIAYIVLGEGLNGEQCLKFIRNVRTENGGISVVTYNNQKCEDMWRLIALNDKNHLGQLFTQD